ncbi:hypothetical protein EV207_1163 [Scopulibacillus darangshiensis]|uniref:Aspartyl protease n=1 Tax=Scopulibacillus darangshiensis TaxID=442528 RepID=A0A4R2P1W1_9BACL|nr:hypothetical protein [Scopulibacillus darangshiensis]TCP28693.1 hypothetical protein EV207_1163 [Scopulibacillus darangshiensis]
MKMALIDGLPIVSINVRYRQKTLHLDHVLLDTGCAVSVFDTDRFVDAGMMSDTDLKKGRAVKMYGIGGQSELCCQQVLDGLNINGYCFNQFISQFGDIFGSYGFDAILGIDFLARGGVLLDFQNLVVNKASTLI